MGRMMTILATAVSLAAWEIYFKGLYFGLTGFTPDFATTLIGYMIPLSAGTIIGWYLGRK